jgi:hypothetical protein
MFLCKYSLDRSNTIASLFRTQYTPDFFIAEYYGLRNTIFWVTKDLASGVKVNRFRNCNAVLYQDIFSLYSNDNYHCETMNNYATSCNCARRINNCATSCNSPNLRR